MKFSYQKRLQCPTREPSAGTSPRLPATAAPPAAAVLAVAAPSSGIATLLHFLLVLEALRSFSCPQHPLCLLIPSTVSFIFNDVNYILFIKNCSGGVTGGCVGNHQRAQRGAACARVCSAVQTTCLCVTNLLYNFLLLLAVSASSQCLGVLCVQYHCELHRLKKWEGLSLSAYLGGCRNRSHKAQDMSRCHFNGGSSNKQSMKTCVEQSCSAHLSYNHCFLFFCFCCCCCFVF